MSIKNITQSICSAIMATLLLVLPLSADAFPLLTQTEDGSTIKFEDQALVKGKTYTSADFPDIKAGSFTVSDDGTTLTFADLTIETSATMFLLEGKDMKLVLQGTNRLTTENFYVIGLKGVTLTITGDGSLTTKTTWYDIWLWPGNVIIDNTSVTCEGPTAIGNNNWASETYYHLTVRNSYLKGTSLFRLTSLSLEGCAITTPAGGLFNADEMNTNQIKDANGNSVNSFVIEKNGTSEEQKGYSVTPSDFGTTYVMKGSSVTIPVKIANRGKENVTSIAYTISTDGNPSEEKTLSLNKLASNNIATINLELSADTDCRKHAKTLTITKVNGAANEAEKKSSTGTLITISSNATPVPVVEEFTGTWCGWCTIGYDGMEKAKEAFGDKAILIAVHSGDPMETSDYDPVAKRVDSYPNSLINRAEEAYPSTSTLSNRLDKCLKELRIGEINMEASWTNNGKTAININTDTKFVYGDSEGQYGIAFVLIEDGMTGTSSGWAQSNYLSGNSNYAVAYPFWYNAPSKVTGLEFNHVAVAAWDIEKGAEGSVKSAFEADEVMKYHRVVDISSNTLIQDKSKLKVAALLIDRSTGNIINAAQASITDKGTPTPASTFSFQYAGEAIEDGGTVTINATEDSRGFGEKECVTNPSANPMNGLIVTTADGSKQSGKATMTISSKTFNATMVQWCMGGECVSMNNKTAFDKEFTTDDNGVCLVQFDATGITSGGELLATLNITIGGENKAVNIKFVNTEGDAPEGEKLWWGYFNDTDASNLTYDSNLGYGKATTINTAIRIPENHPIAGGGTIKGVRFWLADDISAISSDVKVWISPSLPNSVSDAAYTQAIARSALKSRLNEIELTTPYNINNNECYIGFSFSIKEKAYPVLGCGTDMEDAWFYKVTGISWENLDGNGYGKLALQLLLEGVVIKNNSATPSDFGTYYVLKGSETAIPVKILNNGKEAITSIGYTITTDGNVSAEKTRSVSNLEFNNSQTINIPFPADSENKKYMKTLTITKVNGVANEAAMNSSEGNLITITEKPTSVPVVEEFTGTWCGWCTVGYDGMEKAKETFGDKAILIAVHSSDPMETSDYDPVAYKVSGYPSSFVNRYADVYPSAANLSYYINQCINTITTGEIKADAIWINEEKTAIKIDTDTKFVYSEDNGQYGIAYVLIENEMSGTGSGWAQSNYLSGNSSYATDYPFWYNAPSKVSGLKFNHVAVAAWGIAYGVNGSVNSTITADEVQKFNYKVDISNNTIIQDKSKLKIITLLIDKTTGKIVNASETAIKDFDNSAVKAILTPSVQESERYTLDGRKISAPQSGVNIMKMNDGTIRKVFVK